MTWPPANFWHWVQVYCIAAAIATLGIYALLAWLSWRGR